MTSAETKKELSKEYENVKYILTSGMRTKLLLAIYNKPKRLDDLRGELKKPSATILHGLKELENVNLVKKVQKYYELSSKGYLLTTNMIKLLDNWHAINKCKLFWNNHDLSGIPESMLKNIYLLGEAEYVNSTTSDLSSAFNTYIKLSYQNCSFHIIKIGKMDLNSYLKSDSEINVIVTSMLYYFSDFQLHDNAFQFKYIFSEQGDVNKSSNCNV